MAGTDWSPEDLGYEMSVHLSIHILWCTKLYADDINSPIPPPIWCDKSSPNSYSCILDPYFSDCRKMATITASNPATSLVRASVASKGLNGISSPVLGKVFEWNSLLVSLDPSILHGHFLFWVVGLPAMAKKGRVRCMSEEKPCGSDMGSSISMGASLMAAAAAVAASAGPAMALVDERLSTEGTGLPFGLSNNLLGWILFGVFGLIWALYFTYTATLEEDDESGLSLWAKGQS